MNKSPFQKLKNVLLYTVFAVAFIFLTSSFIIEDVYSAADHLTMDVAGISEVYAISIGIPDAGLNIAAEDEESDDQTAEVETDSGDTIVINEYVLGDTSSEILEYQQILYNLGFMTVEPSSTFTEEVQTAVKTYQAMKGLDQSGEFDRSTIISLLAEEIKFERGDSSQVLQTYQEILVEQNYLDEADANGIFGESTETAVMTFQKDNGLEETGKIDSKTMEALDALR
ncbi:peptidoglycan-binding domain-containing protein [Eubacteriaceae bacterium ES3]|nr:peptidoglycan-binding domain-containing protein [Eubacteriaceae bacterium ES3]